MSPYGVLSKTAPLPVEQEADYAGDGGLGQREEKERGHYSSAHLLENTRQADRFEKQQLEQF